MGLGAVHAGVRLYAGVSDDNLALPCSRTLRPFRTKTGMVIKQAEDEITAAQMVSGAYALCTRNSPQHRRRV